MSNDELRQRPDDLRRVEQLALGPREVVGSHDMEVVDRQLLHARPTPSRAYRRTARMDHCGVCAEPGRVPQPVEPPAVLEVVEAEECLLGQPADAVPCVAGDEMTGARYPVNRPGDVLREVARETASG